ncbi:MAG: hypothetical protein ACK5T6_17080 [Pirellula sp.]
MIVFQNAIKATSLYREGTIRAELKPSLRDSDEFNLESILLLSVKYRTTPMTRLSMTVS